MATRFYLPSTGAAAVSPTYGAWTNTADADRRAMVRTRISSAMADSVITDNLLTIGNTHLWRQYVSEPLPAQSISGTFKGQVRTSEDDALANHDRVTMRLIVVSNDGATVRGTLLSLNWYGVTNEYSVTASNNTNRKMADGDTLTNVTAQANDRIVLEVGTQASTTPVGVDLFVWAVFGDDSGTDLPEDESTTAANNAWIEFSGDLFSFPQTLTPSAVSSVGAAIVAVVVAGVATLTPSAVNSVGTASGPNSVQYSVAAVESSGAAVRPESAGVGADSYNPSTPTPLPVNILGAVGMALRPTTPATLGDQQRNSQEDSGHVMGAGSGDINLFATVVQGAQGDLSGTISFLRLYGYVSTRDDVPAGTYVACTAPAFIVKVSGGARTPYGLVSGTIPATMGLDDGPMWTSADLTTRPAGGAWTWTDINNLVELGVTAHYTLGVGNFTNLRLDEVWLEVWGPQGSQVAPLTRVLKAGNLKRQFNIIETFNL